MCAADTGWRRAGAFDRAMAPRRLACAADTARQASRLPARADAGPGPCDRRRPLAAPDCNGRPACGATPCRAPYGTRCAIRGVERQGLLERDVEDSYLAGDGLEAGPLDQLLGSSITYRIAVGPQQGRKVFTLQTLPACEEPFDVEVGTVAGFSLHAGVAARADERKKLERLCRYVSRPAIAEKRLTLTPNGNVRYQLKTPYRGGTTHVIFEPLDFIARLAALVPKARVNLTRLYGSSHQTANNANL